MSRLAATILLAGVVFAAGASAQVDPYPDGLGLYYDEGATLMSADLAVGETAHLYLVATRLSATGVISGWFSEVFFAVQSGANVPLTSGIRGDGINGWIEDPWGPGTVGFDVVFATPFPVTENTVLADVELAVTDPAPIAVYGMGTFGILRELDGGGDHYVTPHHRYDPMPPHTFYMACVNCAYPPVGTEGRTWGQVKGIYR
jgi:hypothetical protein